MTNKEIAKMFSRLGKIMELHGENPFKIRSYNNAYNTLRKIENDLSSLSVSELQKIPGVGKNIAEKIRELIDTGGLKTYQKYVDLTPPGIIEMLEVRGFGPKKIKVVWKDMGIETIGELIYACHENRLVELKGFGAKTQANLQAQLEYHQKSQGKYLYGRIVKSALNVLNLLKSSHPQYKHDMGGGIVRNLPVVEGIKLLTTLHQEGVNGVLEMLELDEDGRYQGYPLEIKSVSVDDYLKVKIINQSPEIFLEELDLDRNYDSEEDFFSSHDLPYILPEYRDYDGVKEKSQGELGAVVQLKDIKGVIHSHSTWSDGVNSLREMAQYSQSRGYQYLVNTDHSKAAFYANGLTEERVLDQFAAIDALNETLDGFKVYKGIEADILNDGSMDYGTEFLRNFELVIASVHSNLKMTTEKATQRIIKAVENPSVHMLGHPTGRLLLSREGYPINHFKVIDACAENDVSIELNANPLRLDLDWTWIPYALERGVKISINPDSHSTGQIDYIECGVAVARKALLPISECINALNGNDFQKWVNSLK